VWKKPDQPSRESRLANVFANLPSSPGLNVGRWFVCFLFRVGVVGGVELHGKEDCRTGIDELQLEQCTGWGLPVTPDGESEPTCQGGKPVFAVDAAARRASYSCFRVVM
jgi:hypothetical protein